MYEINEKWQGIKWQQIALVLLGHLEGPLSLTIWPEYYDNLYFSSDDCKVLS